MNDVTRVLDAIGQGQAGAAEEFLPLVYEGRYAPALADGSLVSGLRRMWSEDSVAPCNARKERPHGLSIQTMPR